MPTIEIELSEKEYLRLQEAYRKAAVAMRDSRPDAPAPDFGHWLGEALPPLYAAQEDNEELNVVRAFTAIEKLVFNLHRLGFLLAHPAKGAAQQSGSLQDLAQSVAGDLQLPPQYVKRIEDLLAHFSKNPKELADAAHVGLTGRGQAALVEAYRLLVERTEKATDHLGSERAIGRVEGGAAMLVAMDVMERDSAKKMTDEFKLKARTGSYSR